MADKPKKKRMTQFQRYLAACKEHGVDGNPERLKETLRKTAGKNMKGKEK